MSAPPPMNPNYIESTQASAPPGGEFQPWGYDYSRIRSTGSVNYDSFNGDIEFNVNASESERWISPKNSYLSIRLRIVQTDETGAAGLLAPIVNIGASKAGATVCSIPYIAPNPGAALFSAISFNIGDDNISNNQNIAQSNTLYRSLYESKLEQETVNSTNPIKYMKIKDTDVVSSVNKAQYLSDYFKSAPNTGYTDANVALTNHKIFALDNMMEFNKYQEIDINTQLLAPIMYSDDLIPPNTPFSLRFTVDSNYHLNVLQIAGSNVSSLPFGAATPFSIVKLTSATSNAGSINTIGVGIVDMNLYLYRVHMPNVVSIPREIFVKQYTSTLHAITQGTHDEFNVDFKKKSTYYSYRMCICTKEGIT